jgi:hypothetical protein
MWRLWVILPILLFVALLYRFDMRPNPWAIGVVVVIAFYFGGRLFEPPDGPEGL